MTVNFIVEAWQFIFALVSIVSAFAVNTYMTKQNSLKTKAHEQKLDDLQNRCNHLMKEQTAREIFVSKELYNNQMEHIDTALVELKKQNETILEYVRK